MAGDLEHCEPSLSELGLSKLLSLFSFFLWSWCPQEKHVLMGDSLMDSRLWSSCPSWVTHLLSIKFWLWGWHPYGWFLQYCGLDVLMRDPSIINWFGSWCPYRILPLSLMSYLILGMWTFAPPRTSSLFSRNHREFRVSLYSWTHLSRECGFGLGFPHHVYPIPQP